MANIYARTGPASKKCAKGSLCTPAQDPTAPCAHAQLAHVHSGVRQADTAALPRRNDLGSAPGLPSPAQQAAPWRLEPESRARVQPCAQTPEDGPVIRARPAGTNEHGWGESTGGGTRWPTGKSPPCGETTTHDGPCAHTPLYPEAHVHGRPCAPRPMGQPAQKHRDTGAREHLCRAAGVHTTRRAQRHMCAPATEHTCTWAPKHSNTGAQGNMCPRTHVRACKRWAGKGTANVHMGCAAHVHRGRSLRKRRGHPGRVHGESCAHVQAATTGPCAPDAGCTCAHWRHGQLPSSSRAHAHMCTWPPTPADHAVQSPPCTCARVRLYSNNSKSLRLHPRTRLQPPARVPGFV